MSSFGIGLGAFVDGLAEGQKLRQNWNKMRKERQDQQSLQSLNKDTKAQFDADVKAGSADPNQFEQFWLQYALPRRKAQLLQEGRYDDAKKLDDWGKSSAALEGGKLFASALLKAQTGDPEGALNDAIKSGQVQGYIKHGYDLVKKEKIEDSNGNLLGYRLHLKEGNNEVTQDVAVKDLPKMIATYANPINAFKTQTETAKANSKEARDLQDYAAKKKIDATYKGPANASEDYRKVYDSLLKNDLSFADKSPDDQDKQVRAALAAQNRYAASRNPSIGLGLGKSNATAQQPPAPQRIVVDKATGQPVQPSAATAAPPTGTTAPGVTGIENRYSPDAVTSAPASAPQAAATGQGPALSTAAPSTGTPDTDQGAMLAAADQAIKSGSDPRAVAEKLKGAGIQPSEWPASVRQAVESQYVFGGGDQPGIGVSQ